MKVRLALREEGSFWNAYIANTDTMNNAMLIGSIAMAVVRKNPKIKEIFQELMKMVLADTIEQVTGEAPDKWDVGPAPESERSGHS